MGPFCRAFVVERLNGEVQKAMKEPSVRERFVALAVDVAELMTPEAFAAYVKVQSERYSRLTSNWGSLNR